MQRRVVAAWSLIIFGSILLLHQLDFFELNRANIISVGSILIGGLLFSRGWSHPTHNGILSGSFFILLGLSFLSMRFSFIPINDSIGVGILLYCLGLANIIYFGFIKTKISNLVFGLVFLIVGTPFILAYYYYIPYWELGDLFAKYWPILLILIGIGLLTEGLLRNLRRSQKDITKTI